jgi:hypothetical protein
MPKSAFLGFKSAPIFCGVLGVLCEAVNRHANGAGSFSGSLASAGSGSSGKTRTATEHCRILEFQSQPKRRRPGQA